MWDFWCQMQTGSKIACHNNWQNCSQLHMLLFLTCHKDRKLLQFTVDLLLLLSHDLEKLFFLKPQLQEYTRWLGMMPDRNTVDCTCSRGLCVSQRQKACTVYCKSVLPVAQWKLTLKCLKWIDTSFRWSRSVWWFCRNTINHSCIHFLSNKD